MERKLTRDDILDILLDSDAESGSSSDGQLSESDEEAHLLENLAGCDRSEAPAIPDNAGPASEGAVVEDFLPTWTSNPYSPPALDFDNTTKGVQGEEHTQALQGLPDHQKVPTEKAKDEVHV
ncbi:hypothetical protein G5714_000115 [Onychostoma macrolepis]|uniref:Uncharacterized protein n=1 Tax=Onychostoma macrolepis TaxID=369639 RepID=A0A7J6DH07_9TELE|nr:hypothetical protein G5714_000115 [Onychostoma macrolepis]